MHYALVFSTSKQPSSTSDAASWLAKLADHYGFLQPAETPHWLHQGYAAQLICDPDVSFNVTSPTHNPEFRTLRSHAAELGLDVNIIPFAGRRKQMLIADMDSTIITGESLDDLAVLAGLGDAVTAITKRAMTGEIDFEGALFERVAMLAGKPSSLFDQLIAAATPTPGAIELVQTMRANGARCYLVSGGFDVITGPVAAVCGFHKHHANHMHIADGKILGTVQTPVLDRDAKAGYLAHYCTLHGITPNEAATIGDGANDLAMLQAAGMGVAFNGKPLLLSEVAIQLNHTDLKGLLYLQGYQDSDIVTG